MRRLILSFCLAVILGFSGVADASLIDRGVDAGGNHLIYDTDYDITWYDAPAIYRNWTDSIVWASQLTAGGVIGWRLPTAYNPGLTGPDWGYSVTGSEMGHLYYTELGNSAGEPLANTGPFANLQSWPYWSGTEFAPDPSAAWFFFIGECFIGDCSGYQGAGGKGIGYSALAVHSGDVAPVPIPGTLLLFGTGIVGLGALRRRMGRLR